MDLVPLAVNIETLFVFCECDREIRHGLSSEGSVGSAHNSHQRNWPAGTDSADGEMTTQAPGRCRKQRRGSRPYKRASFNSARCANYRARNNELVRQPFDPDPGPGSSAPPAFSWS